MRNRKKKDRSKLYLAVFVIFIMVSSTIGFVLDFAVSPQEGQSSIEYNGYEFSQTGEGLLTTSINGVQALFGYFPADVQHIEIPKSVLEAMKNASALKVAYDPDSEAASLLGFIQYSFERTIPAVNGIVVLRGTTSVIEESNLPVYSCDNATNEQPVVLLMQDESTGASVEGSCIKIIGQDGPSLMQIHDRILYTLFGVLEDE